MDTVTLVVTAEHARRGLAKDNKECPVALALRDMYPGYSISVGSNVATCTKEEYDIGLDEYQVLDEALFEIPPELQKRINRFDQMNDYVTRLNLTGSWQLRKKENPYATEAE